MLADAGFRAGIACLAARGLVYDAWQYYSQLPEVGALADALPHAAIVVNHCGGVLGLGRHGGPDLFPRWKALVTEAARRPNIYMKLGGLGGRRSGLVEGRAAGPQVLADAFRPYIETCIELFGADRCMFESNVPPDAVAGSYATIWNAFKMIAAGCSPAEKAALFSGTARRVYRLA